MAPSLARSLARSLTCLLDDGVYERADTTLEKQAGEHQKARCACFSVLTVTSESRATMRQRWLSYHISPATVSKLASVI